MTGGPRIEGCHELVGKAKRPRWVSASCRAPRAGPLAADCFWHCLFHILVLPYSGLKNKRPVAVLKTPRQAWPKPNEVSHIAQVNSDNSTPMPAVSTWRRFLSQAAGVAASLTLRWPTGRLRSFSAGGLRLHKQKTALRSRGDPEGRLESIAVHDDALALLNRTSGELFRGRRFTPSGFSLDDSCRRGFSFHSRNSHKGADK